MEKNNLTGYARIICNVLMPLNKKDVFKKRYANVHKRYVLNSPHWSTAALIIVDNGSLRVEGISKNPAEEFDRVIRDSEAYVEMSTYAFLAFAMKRLSMAGLIMRWLTHDVKMKRPWRLLTLYRIYRLVDSRLA